MKYEPSFLTTVLIIMWAYIILTLAYTHESAPSNTIKLPIRVIKAYHYKNNGEDIKAGDDGIWVTFDLSKENISKLNFLNDTCPVLFDISLYPALRDWELTTILSDDPEADWEWLLPLKETKYYMKGLWPLSHFDQNEDHQIHVILHKIRPTEELKQINHVKNYLNVFCPIWAEKDKR